MANSKKALHWTLVVLLVFLGLTSVAGGIGLLTGGGAPGLELLRGSPFSDYTIPGLSLMILVGGAGLVAAILVIRRHRLGLVAAGLAGFDMVFFEIVEIQVIGHQTAAALFFQGFGIVLGLAIMLLAATLWSLDRRHPATV